MTANDLIARTRITEVWAALGGGDPRRGRGRAFWRGGDSYNISLNEEKKTFYDHARGEGGGVLDLICLTRECNQQTALRWLADHLGLPFDDRELTQSERQQWRQDRADRRAAQHFATAADKLAEELLYHLAWFDPRRGPLTDLRRTFRDARKLLIVFREWKQHSPELTEALVKAGQAAGLRRRRLVEQFLTDMEVCHAA